MGFLWTGLSRDVFRLVDFQQVSPLPPQIRFAEPTGYAGDDVLRVYVELAGN